MKKIFIICILLLAGISVDGQYNRDSISMILNDKNMEVDTRVRTAFGKMQLPMEAEEQEYVLKDLLMPFVNEHVKDPVLKQSYKMAISMSLVGVYFKLRDMDGRMNSMMQAFELAEMPLKDTITASAEAMALYDEERAKIYRVYGQMQTQIGDMGKGHEYLYKAIRLYEKLNRPERVSTCLYIIAENFTQISDAKRLGEIAKKMEENIRENSSKSEIYNLYSTKISYYSVLLQEDTTGTVNYAFVDSVLSNSYKAALIIEQYPNELSRTVNPAITYFNMAIIMNKYYSDSIGAIYRYLDKALETRLSWDPVSSKEIDLRVNLMYARLYLQEKKYDLAEEKALHVLSLLNDVKDRNTVITDYIEVYELLALLYEKTNRYEKSIQNYKLLLENKEKLFNNEKIAVMNEMTTKYEVEKKEAQITWLEEKNKTARLILMLTIGLLAVLVVIIILIIYFYRLRRKNLEQKVYESALLAELRQTELERNAEEKQLLQQQYDNLEALAGQNVQQTESLTAELQQIKQQIEQKPTQAMVEKTMQTISKSLIPKYNKEQYMERLKNLDTDVLEQGYLMADEKITNMDMKYIICFASDMDVKDISLIFNVEPASVRTVRYRIKKKFGEKNMFKFLI